MLCIKYTVVFLILVFYISFSLFFGILEGLSQVFWYSTIPLTRVAIHFNQYSFGCALIFGALVLLSVVSLLEITSSASLNCN